MLGARLQVDLRPKRIPSGKIRVRPRAWTSALALLAFSSAAFDCGNPAGGGGGGDPGGGNPTDSGGIVAPASGGDASTGSGGGTTSSGTTGGMTTTGSTATTTGSTTTTGGTATGDTTGTVSATTTGSTTGTVSTTTTGSTTGTGSTTTTVSTTTTGSTTGGSSGCAGTLTKCGGTCVDTTGSQTNCGTCGNACRSDETCWQSACICPTGQGNCGGACKDVTASTTNCGTCGNACATGGSCVSSVCQCPTGETACSGACTTLNTDPKNCGVCGTVCGSGTSCLFGACLDPSSLSCTPTAQANKSSTNAASITLGKYWINNNEWGASSGSGTQSIWSDCEDGDLIAWGTSWNWTGTTNAVKSYASSVLGWQFGWKLTNTGLPLQISTGSAVNCGWSFNMTQSGGSADVAYDTFIHAIAMPGTNDNPTDEMMVWLYATDGAAPTGTKQATVTIDSTSWNLYRGATTWNVFSYVRATNATTAVVNIMDFLNDLVSRGWLQSSKYLTSVQSGTEIFTGTGELDTTGYYCRVQ